MLATDREYAQPPCNFLAAMQGIHSPQRRQPPHVSYAHNRLLLLSLISDSQELIRSLEQYAQPKRNLLYPLLATASRGRGSMTASSNVNQTHRRGDSTNSAKSSAGSNNNNYSYNNISHGHVLLSPASRASSHDYADHANNIPQFTVLHLDIPLGSSLSMLPEITLSQLLSAKLKDLLSHLSHMHTRVEDNASRLLVTGDLNAGKSTFVNALLRRDLLPADQQPLTGVFTEVVDARHNNGIEEIHCLKDTGNEYSPDDASTFARCGMNDLYRLVTDVDEYKLLKIYYNGRLRDSDNYNSTTLQSSKDNLHAHADDNTHYQSYHRDHYNHQMQTTPSHSRQYDSAQTTPTADDETNILHNDVVDIRVIDSPGLNRDMWKTMALFSRQKEIDVIVFVVSAENHFTQSGREFLLNAGKEKAYIFIVVNKFDGIRDKNRCRKLILQQIEQLSPHTYANAEKLVHFVSSSALLEPPRQITPVLTYNNNYQAVHSTYGSGEIRNDISECADNTTVCIPSEFQSLERALKEFTLEKRSISKLFPAKMLLSNLLTDIDLLLNYNVDKTTMQLQTLKRELSQIQPLLSEMGTVKEDSLDRMNAMIASASNAASQFAVSRLSEKCLGDILTQRAREVPWHGIWHAYEYVSNVKQKLLAELTVQLSGCQHYTVENVQDLTQKLYTAANNPLWDYQNTTPGFSKSDSLYSSMTNIAAVSTNDPHDNSSANSVAKALSTPLTTIHPLSFRVNLTTIVYEYRDKLSSVSLALTGCSFLASSILGVGSGFSSRSLAIDAFRVGMEVGMKRVGKMAVIGFGVFGAITAYNLLSSLPRTLPHLFTRSLLLHLDTTGYVATTSNYLANATRITLSYTMVELTSKMDQAIVNVRDRQRLLTDDLSVSKEAISLLDAFKRRCCELERRVGEVELNVSDSRSTLMVPISSPMIESVLPSYSYRTSY